MFCEHHEDLLAMWPAKNPSSYCVMQVKTQGGNSPGNWSWTAARLCNRKKGTKDESSNPKVLGSPLGKLLGSARHLYAP